MCNFCEERVVYTTEHFRKKELCEITKYHIDEDEFLKSHILKITVQKPKLPIEEIEIPIYYCPECGEQLGGIY